MSRSIEDAASEVAQFTGFSQAMTYSFESPKVFDKLKLAADSEYRKTVVISNPLGEDFSINENTSIHGMLTSLSTNYNRRNKNVKLYELAKIYLAADDVNELPDERVEFTLGAFGSVDFYSMKGVIEEFLEKIGMKKKPTYDAKAGIPFFIQDVRLMYITLIRRLVTSENFIRMLPILTQSVREHILLLLIFQQLQKWQALIRSSQELQSSQPVTRDISMVMPKELPVGEVEKIIEKRGGKILEKLQPLRHLRRKPD